jgi:carboxylate-amine ligase
MTDDLREPRFGDSDPFSLGVEEELFLVDPDDGSQVDGRERVLEALGEPPRGKITGEVHACEVELITDVCATPGEAIEVLADLRRRVRATGVGIMATATHPTAPEGESEVSDTERYHFVAELLGDALASPVAALHVHVGMPDAETAIRVFNGLRRHLPLIEALAANSPFRHGRDSRYASARGLALRSWPRSGVPRAMADYDDFVAFAERLTRAADVPDYTYHWWKLRPHPKLGTVEVRAHDVQAPLADTASLAALVQSLARHEAEADPEPAPPGEILEENFCRANRGGVGAELADDDGALRPVSELAHAAVALARPHAARLGCEEALDGVLTLLADGGGAAAQRRDHDRNGFPGVLAGLLERTD